MIYILIIVIIIASLLLIGFTYREHFTPESIQFLETTQICRVLKGVDFTYNKLDINVRKIPREYRKDIYKFYCDNLLSFTSLDKKLIKWVVEGMRKKIPKKFRFILLNLRFAKYRNFIENGFPHTHKDVIFISESFINEILGFYNNNNLVGAIEGPGATMIHEAVHISQRKYPNEYLDLYENYWKFAKVDEIYNNEYLKKKIRFNPDGPDTNWVFNMKGKHIYILSIYRENATDIGQVDYVGILLEKENNKYIVPNGVKPKSLTEIDEFTYFFENLWGNHYHPNEISAELLSIFYLKQMKISHGNYKNIGYNNMLIWLEKNLDLFNK
tara:strand:+ start:347 stop:1327 length:981 start_codon:yes stop_codon:yes gene_type:complete